MTNRATRIASPERPAPRRRQSPDSRGLRRAHNTRLGSELSSHRPRSVTTSAYAAAVFCSWSSGAMYAANRSARSGRGAKDQRAYPSRPLRRFRANRRTRRADRPTASPRARRKCPCVTLVDRVKFAWAHRRRAQGDPSSPGSDEPFGPRVAAVSRSPLGYAARCRGLDRCGRPPGLAMTRVVSAESPRPCDARSPVPGGAFRE